MQLDLGDPETAGARLEGWAGAGRRRCLLPACMAACAAVVNLRPFPPPPLPSSSTANSPVGPALPHCAGVQHRAARLVAVPAPQRAGRRAAAARGHRQYRHRQARCGGQRLELQMHRGAKLRAGGGSGHSPRCRHHTRLPRCCRVGPQQPQPRAAPQARGGPHSARGAGAAAGAVGAAQGPLWGVPRAGRSVSG